MKILGIIPARGGSKGIPNKNRKLLFGKPLLQYTIEAALDSKLLDEVMFTSEDETLINMARSLGAKIPYTRPDYLAIDTAGSLEVVQHLLNELKTRGDEYDAICLLQVTSPFRSAGFIDKAIKVFQKEKTDSLISVVKVPHEFNPHWVFEVSDQGNLRLSTGEREIIKRRQDLPNAFIRDGSIYITKTDVIMNENTFYGNKIGYIETNPEVHVNLDSMSDWAKAIEIGKKLGF